MTNSFLLKQKIKDSGLQIGYIAEQLGITRQGLWLKIMNKVDFKLPEVACLCKLLAIKSLTEKEKIFFAVRDDN